MVWPLKLSLATMAIDASLISNLVIEAEVQPRSSQMYSIWLPLEAAAGMCEPLGLARNRSLHSTGESNTGPGTSVHLVKWAAEYGHKFR